MGEKPEKQEKHEKTEKSEKHEKTEKSEKPEKTEKSEKSEKPEKPEKPKGTMGKHITVLSIDGGSVRGLIPITILMELEGILQRLDGAERRLLDYFDMIAGTTTGGVATAMITTPCTRHSNRPLFTAIEVFNFYDRHAKIMFPQSSISDFLGSSLVSKANEMDRLLHATFCRNPHLSSTLTSVLIPTFDIRIKQPILFTSWQAKQDALDNPRVDLVCSSTSAAPACVPPVNFTLTDMKANPPRAKQYNLIDGAVAVNNPTEVAITQAIKEMQSVGSKARVKYKSYSDLLVLSLGTGQNSMGCYAREAPRYGIRCLGKKGEAPWVDNTLNASTDMVDYNLSQMFQCDNCSQNYLRIQNNRNLASIDDCDPEYLPKVIATGRKILNEPEGGTNRDALTRFAGWLVEERKARSSKQLTPPKKVDNSTQTWDRKKPAPFQPWCPPSPPHCQPWCPPSPPPCQPCCPPTPPPCQPCCPPKHCRPCSPPKPKPEPKPPPPYPCVSIILPPCRPCSPPKPEPPKPDPPPPPPCRPCYPIILPPCRPCHPPPKPKPPEPEAPKPEHPPPSHPCYPVMPPWRPYYCPPKPKPPSPPPSHPWHPITPLPIYYPGGFYYDQSPYDYRYYVDCMGDGPCALVKYETSFDRSSDAQAPTESTFLTSPFELSAYDYSNSHHPDPTYCASMEETQSTSSSPYLEPPYNHFYSHDHQSFSVPSNPELGSSSTLLDFFGLLS